MVDILSQGDMTSTKGQEHVSGPFVQSCLRHWGDGRRRDLWPGRMERPGPIGGCSDQGIAILICHFTKKMMTKQWIDELANIDWANGFWVVYGVNASRGQARVDILASWHFGGGVKKGNSVLLGSARAYSQAATLGFPLSANSHSVRCLDYKLYLCISLLSLDSVCKLCSVLMLCPDRVKSKTITQAQIQRQ